MSKYNSQYYFVHKARDDRLPGMTPDEDTANRDFSFGRMPVGIKPLIFHNGNLDWQNKHNVKPTDPPPDYLFCGADVLVKDSVREALWQLEIPRLMIQPSIYIDHKNQWHENYWYLTFLELFDCWDRQASVFNPEPLTLGGERFDVYNYSLSEELLDKTPLAERQLFKMGGTLDPMVVVHQSMVKYFRGSGADLVPIADYGVSYP